MCPTSAGLEIPIRDHRMGFFSTHTLPLSLFVVLQVSLFYLDVKGFDQVLNRLDAVSVNHFHRPCGLIIVEVVVVAADFYCAESFNLSVLCVEGDASVHVDGAERNVVIVSNPAARFRRELFHLGRKPKAIEDWFCYVGFVDKNVVVPRSGRVVDFRVVVFDVPLNDLKGDSLVGSPP